MRITTNMVMRNYQSNLTSSLGGLERARKQVESGRRFSQSYEDPSAAARGAILERRYSRNSDYLNSVKEAQKWQDSQEDVLKQLNTIATQIGSDFSTKAMSDTTGDTGRNAYAATLRELQKSMVNALNTAYGDAFVMAGGDAKNPPFKIDENGDVLYRDLNVDSDDADVLAKLAKLSKETSYIDLGFGLKFDDTTGDIISSSAFDTAFPGINAVGYGQTDDGTSKNLIVLAGKMADLLDKEVFDKDAYGKLWTQFNQSTQSMKDQFTKIGTKSQQLAATQTRLEAEKLNIEEQYKNAVGIEETEAITNFSWAQYVYNVALKIGTNIINPSLLDFMK